MLLASHHSNSGPAFTLSFSYKYAAATIVKVWDGWQELESIHRPRISTPTIAPAYRFNQPPVSSLPIPQKYLDSFTDL